MLRQKNNIPTCKRLPTIYQMHRPKASMEAAGMTMYIRLISHIDSNLLIFYRQPDID